MNGVKLTAASALTTLQLLLCTPLVLIDIAALSHYGHFATTPLEALWISPILCILLMGVNILILWLPEHLAKKLVK